MDPPSTLSVWPVIQPDASEAKNSTALAMSSGLPSRRSGIESTSARCLSSPYDCHWRSVAGLLRTKPGATQLAVMPHGPSSCAVCRVKPICPALALAYAWIPVRLTVRPAPEEMLTIRP